MIKFSEPLLAKITIGFVASSIVTGLHGQLSVDIFFSSFAVGYTFAFVVHGLGSRGGVGVLRGIFKLAGVFLVDLVIANFQLARDVLSPNPKFHPAIIGIETSKLTMGERVLLAIMITLTPGSFALDSTDDGNQLIVHTLYARDVNYTREHLNRYVNLVEATRISKMFEG